MTYVNNSEIKTGETSHTGFQMKKCHFKNVSSLVCICQASCNLFLLSFFIAALFNTTWSKLKFESFSVWGWLHLYWLWYVLGISREHHIGMPKIYTRLIKHSRTPGCSVDTPKIEVNRFENTDQATFTRQPEII